ncbi:glycoside hydrolase family 16 protein [Myriangium duriaei CBS 260.36]|uniref:Glycoside hydrolase family 16 protein n=1 Tax=Myriangium duriaei CBS 260.36 TaxID=1168546 RepID=A0A9P4MGV8_9PEZI|nr:glycoside hydrolase family 16 protein [Myriangium duriaei CBS 260.36]
MLAPLLVTSLLALPGCLAQSFTLTDTYSGSNFFNKFNFFTGGDPTAGWVHYVDYNTALSTGLIPNANNPLWGVDHTNVLDPGNPAGRPSIRISSQKTYNHGLFIADVEHMPDSTCGLWPAYWFLGQTGTWPNSGELDVIEGVNNGHTNLISAHTKSGCTISGSGQTATLQTNDCAVPDGTTGCSSSDPRTNSYGSGFNAQGGGVYAVDWTSADIRVWFFPRSAIPASISSGNPNPQADFGTPTAVFGGSCNIDAMFFDMAIVFDTTFCGQWAGQVYQGQGCPMYNGQASWPSCVTYVAQNPNAFTQAYWEINYIKVFQQTGGAVEHVVLPSAVPSLMSNVTVASVAMGRPTGAHA